MTIEINEKDNITVIQLDEDAGIYCADEIKSKLLQTISEVEHVEVNLGNVKSADLSTLQTLYSASLYAKEQKKKFSYTRVDCPAIRNVIYSAGFSEDDLIISKILNQTGAL